MARRRPRGLSEEDRALWERVAASARPLKGSTAAPPPQAGAPKPSVAQPRPAPHPPEPAPADPPPASPRRLRIEGRPRPAVSWTPPIDDRPAPVARGTPGLDRNTARRLARGQRDPEARLDLHGMTVDRAHRALTRFVFDSRALGLRCVLVVTGKGRGADGGRGEGVLRRDTPRWLATPPLSEAVVGVYQAHAKHGGGGALYVYLKRMR